MISLGKRKIDLMNLIKLWCRKKVLMKPVLPAHSDKIMIYYLFDWQHETQYVTRLINIPNKQQPEIRESWHVTAKKWYRIEKQCKSCLLFVQNWYLIFLVSLPIKKNIDNILSLKYIHVHIEIAKHGDIMNYKCNERKAYVRLRHLYG